MEDFIKTFVATCSKLPSPHIMLQWSAISAIAAVAQRRYWCAARWGKLYPNIYVWLIGHPASGKTVGVDEARSLLRQLDVAFVEQGSTKARLLDMMKKADRPLIQEGETQCSMFVCVNEFGNFMTKYDALLMNVLIEMWDSRSEYDDGTRTSNSVALVNPQLNMLVATTPNWLSETMPESAWSGGLMSRSIMIYSDKRFKQKLLGPSVKKDPRMQELLTFLAKIQNKSGELIWEDSAFEAYDAWAEADLEPAPSHPRLAHYCSRRGAMILKLSMIAALSRSSMTISLADFERAQDWLLEAEKTMPQVFAAMTSKSDKPTLDELWRHCWDLYCATKQGIPSAILWQFLQQRASAERIPRLIEAAVRCDLFDRPAGTDLYVPTPPNKHTYHSEK